jgi:hypothetical protein
LRRKRLEQNKTPHPPPPRTVCRYLNGACHRMGAQIEAGAGGQGKSMKKEVQLYE